MKTMKFISLGIHCENKKVVRQHRHTYNIKMKTEVDDINQT
jgi:hypothetical protein